MYALKKIRKNKMKGGFEYGDLAYGLAIPRLNFLRLNNVSLERRFGAVMDVFAATKTEHKLILSNNEMYPHLQDSFNDSLDFHHKYKCIREKMGFLIDNKTVFDDPEWISRKCKAGLYWVAQKNITVHFVLDDVDMDRVVFKKDKSYTASELRWFFRNKDNDNVKRVVKYWKDGGYVSAPWESDEGRELWENYKPKSHK